MAWKKTKAGSWQKQIWVHGRPLTLTFAGSKAEAHEYEARKRVELGAVEKLEGRGNVYAFESFCADKYKPWAKVNLRASTYGVRRFQLENLILHLGKAKLTRLTEPTIEAYKMERLSEKASKVTVNSELNVLSAVMACARDRLKLPCAAPKIARFKIAKRKDKVECWTRDEVLRILDTTRREAKWFFPLFLFLFETGCRKSEAVALQWKRVSFERGIVRVWNDEEEDYEVKTKEREVPISDYLAVVLKEQKLKNGASPWLFPCVTNRFAGTKGARLHEFPDNAWRRIVKLAGLSGGPHKSRHTFASHYLASKPDLFRLGRILGHSHSRVTELYSHLLPGHLAEDRNVVSFGPASAEGGPR